VSANVLPQLGVPEDLALATGYGAYVNSSSYWARVIELTGQAALGPYVTASASYTHMKAVVTESFTGSVLAPSINPAFPDISIGQYAPLVGAAPFRRPANTTSFLVSFLRGPVSAAVAGYVAGKSDDSTYASDAFFSSSLLLPNHDLDAAYGKVDVSGSYRLSSMLRWYVSVENLFDASYQPAFGYPALPRTLRSGVTLTFGGDAPRHP
jgi:iron complex outermembrane receptor protein/vitamin B12 transporter